MINTKLYMELNWTKFSVLCNQDQNSIFQITKGELYIPVVTLNTENNNKLSELLSKGFERTIDVSFQGVSRLFAAAYETRDIGRNTNHQHSRRRCYLPRAEIKDYNVLINGRNFYDQNVNSSIVRYNELLK